MAADGELRMATETNEPVPIMFPIQTPQLVLTPCGAATAPKLAEILSDERVHQPFYIGRPDARLLALDSASWKTSAESWRHEGRFGVAAHRRVDGELTGCVVVTLDHLACHLAYFVAPRFWGQGLGYEMVAACVPRLPALLGMKRIETHVVRDNVASRRILEKCGFVFAGLGSHRRMGGHGHIATLHYRRDTMALDDCETRTLR